MLTQNYPAVMSASEKQETVYECIRGGAEEYLVKPVTKKEVQNIWTHVMKRVGGSSSGVPIRISVSDADSVVAARALSAPVHRQAL